MQDKKPLIMQPRTLHTNAWLYAALVIAFAPIFHTLATWDLDGKLTSRAFALRHYSIPVLVLELAVIWLAARTGFDTKYLSVTVPKPIKLFLFVWCFLAVFAAIYTVNYLAISFFNTFRYFIHISAFASLVFLIAVSKHFAIETWVKFATISGIIYTATLIVFIMLVPDPESFSWAYRLPSATNVRQIGNNLALLAIAPLALLLAPDTKRRSLYFFSVTVTVAFISWTGTRGALFGLVIGSVAGIIAVTGFASLRNIAIATISAIAGAILSIAIPIPDPIFGLFRMVSSVSAEDVSSGRIQMWLDTIAEISKQPFFGYGSGRFRENMIEIYSLDYNHPHNFVLQFIYDWGIFGGIIALGLIAWLGFRIISIKQVGRTDHFLAVAGFATLLAIGSIEGTLFHPLPILIGIFLMAPAIGAAQGRTLPAFSE